MERHVIRDIRRVTIYTIDVTRDMGDTAQQWMIEVGLIFAPRMGTCNLIPDIHIVLK